MKKSLVLGGSLALGALGAFLMSSDGNNLNPGKKFGTTTEDLPPDVDPGIGASGSAFAHSLPEHPGPQREAAIFSAVISGDAMIRWSFVVAQDSGHEAVIPVMARALSIGHPGDSWRIVCTYPTAQKIADELSCVMLTPRVADLIFLQSDIQLSPMTRQWSQDGTMALTSRTIEQSLALDKLVPADGAGLVSNEGKHWVNSQRLYKPLGSPGDATFDNWNKPAGTLGSKHNGPNYGWHQKSSGKPIQDVGLAHDFGHSDYSQMVVLMSRIIHIDDEEHHVVDVLKDPVLSRLLSNEGPLPRAVHPDLISLV